MAHIKHNVSASACQVDGDVVLRELATASSISSFSSNDSYPVDTQGLPLQRLAVPATHYNSQENHRTPYPSYGDSLFSPLTYLPHALSVDSYPDGEKQSGVPTFTDGQQEIQFGSSGGYVEEMDFGVQPDTAHYQKPSALHGQQRLTDTFRAFPERDNDFPPLGHSALKTDDSTTLVSHDTDGAGCPRAYYPQAPTPTTQPVLVPHLPFLIQPAHVPHPNIPTQPAYHIPTQPAYLPRPNIPTQPTYLPRPNIPTQPAYLPRPNTPTQPAPLPHPQWPSYTLLIKNAVPAPIELILANPCPASEPEDTEKPTTCGWCEENQTIPCNAVITESNLQEHLASHGIEHMASNRKVKCRSCTQPKEMKRESILRHFRERHLKQRRKQKKKKLVEG